MQFRKLSVKAYQHLQDFEQRSSFGTWLTRILINEALIKRKRQNRFHTIDLGMHEFVYKLKNIIFIENSTPEKHLLNNELRNVLEKAILDLPKNYSQVYVMRELEQMNVKETSECLGITETNVKVRLCRDKTRLKKFITNTFSEAEMFSFHLTRCNRIVQNVLQRL